MNVSANQAHILFGRKFTILRDEVKSATNIDKNNGKIVLLDTGTTEPGGCCFGFNIITSDALVKVEAILYLHSGSQFALIDCRLKDYIRRGIGLSPGDVIANPDGSVPDMHGTPNPTYPWLARYYDNSLTNTPLADGTDVTDNRVSLMYTPTTLIPYDRFVITLTNTDDNEHDLMYSAVDRFQFLD